jgi:raffinose synthase
MLQNSDPNPGSDQTSGRPYVLFLPIIEGQFRASLQSGENDNISVCVESSSTLVTNSQYDAVVYIHAGNDPFKLVKEAMKTVRAHLGTFKLLEEKSVPGIAEKFGWCTWDAFYLKVHPQGIWEGVQNLTNGGCPPGFVLIDDGWQSIAHDDDPIDTNDGINRTDAGEQMPCRLIKFDENYKFKDYKNGLGLGGFVKEIKKGFESVEYVYVWHALCGYWGGIRPGVEGVPNAIVEKPKLTVGLETTMEDLAVDKIVNNGVGLVPPHLVDQMYEGIHSHLEDSGIDGVKVDVIHVSTSLLSFNLIFFSCLIENEINN